MLGEFKELLFENQFEFIPANETTPYTLSSKTATVFVFNKKIRELETTSMMTYAQELQVKTREERLAHLYASAHTKVLTPGKQMDVLTDFMPQKIKSTSVVPLVATKKVTD